LGLKFAEYCQPPRHTPNTAASYVNRFTMFVTWAEERGVKTADDVTSSVMSEYVRSRTTAGAGPATINRDVIAVRLAFAFALRDELIVDDPFETRPFRKLKLREPRPKPNALTLSPTQIDTFLDAAERMTAPAYAALFRLAAGSGIRIDEARHVELSDVDEARSMLTVTPKPGWTSKGYRYRDIPVSERTVKAAKVFILTRAKVVLDDKTVWKELHRVRLAAQVPRFTMHDLRRAWASAMHANGASLKQVSVWLGHADIATTERYIRVFETATAGHEFLPR
jgi:site-specific recombinase XerD